MDSSEFKAAIIDHLKREKPEFQLKNFVFHEHLLSPVRNQAEIGACTFVASLACIEMHCRKANVGIPNWIDDGYLDIDDAYNNIFIKYDHKIRFHDVESKKRGTKTSEVLQYIKEFGVPVTNVPWNPRIRNSYSVFCNEVPRLKLLSYMRVHPGEAFALASEFPIIGSLKLPDSFRSKPDKFIFHDDDAEVVENSSSGHAMVVVGRATFTNGKEHDYFIMQNSWDETSGYRGFVLISVKIPFNCFFLPAMTSDTEKLFLDIERVRVTRDKKRKLDQAESSSQFQSDGQAASYSRRWSSC
ncbi:uncharacterized protein [Henckelia pumila]|uniref:uncharacterized protein n=1 Tax=Henckelia pumila TaxID=405737 RepID=UPI003C6E7D5F